MSDDEDSNQEPEEEEGGLLGGLNLGKMVEDLEEQVSGKDSLPGGILDTVKQSGLGGDTGEGEDQGEGEAHAEGDEQSEGQEENQDDEGDENSHESDAEYWARVWREH